MCDGYLLNSMTQRLYNATLNLLDHMGAVFGVFRLGPQLGNCQASIFFHTVSVTSSSALVPCPWPPLTSCKAIPAICSYSPWYWLLLSINL